MTHKSPGYRFQQALALQKPLQIVGTINAYIAIMTKKMGFKAIYLSGAGVANASYGLPDLGLTTLDNVLTDARRITEAVDLPLLVDIDTGWGNVLMIERVIKLLERAGVAAIHIEDQVFAKRCGHRSGKALVSKEDMVDRIKAAVDARDDPHFTIMARTDAFLIEGKEITLERCIAYEKAGADMHFLEALTTLEDYAFFRSALTKPILANCTEFGKTPLFTKEDFRSVGVDAILYPLSVFRAMSLAALKALNTLQSKENQESILDLMQTREELYGFLEYEKYESIADQLTKN